VVALFATVETTRYSLSVAALAAAGVVVLALALGRGVGAGVGASLAALGAAWSVSAWTRSADAPAGTMLAAAGLVVVAELAFAALEQSPVPDEGELVARRLAGIAGRAAGALALAAVLLAALGLHARGGLALEAVGIAAAVGLLMLLFVLGREHPHAER
jgi:hypothetical protein